MQNSEPRARSSMLTGSGTGRSSGKMLNCVSYVTPGGPGMSSCQPEAVMYALRSPPIAKVRATAVLSPMAGQLLELGRFSVPKFELKLTMPVSVESEEEV